MSIFNIQVTNEAGQPIPGLDIRESNEVKNDTNGLSNIQNPSAAQTNANGAFFDLVTGNANVSNYELSQSEAQLVVNNQVESRTSFTTIQTLTISAPGYGVLGTAVYERTFTNMDGPNRRPAINARGRHVNNFTVSATPVTMTYP
jgi:hypothetical protein